MATIYEEVEIEDMRFDAMTGVLTYPCPCGDKFSITLDELFDGEEIATCPSCTLRIRVVCDDDALDKLDKEREQALAGEGPLCDVAKKDELEDMVDEEQMQPAEA